MKKLKKIILVLITFVFMFCTFAVAACNNTENGNEGGADKEIGSQYKKPVIADGVKLNDINDLNSIIIALSEIRGVIGPYEYMSQKNVNKISYTVYGKRTIKKVLNGFNYNSSKKQYKNIIGEKEDVRVFYCDMRYISDENSSAAKLIFDLIKRDNYKDNLKATEDYARTETQKYLITDKDGTVNRYFNGNLEDSVPEENYIFNSIYNSSFTIESFYGSFSNIYFEKNMKPNENEDDYLRKIINDVEACAYYNSDIILFPIADYTDEDYLSLGYSSDFDGTRYNLDYNPDGISYSLYDSFEVIKHSLTVKSNSNQYWFDLDVELKFNNRSARISKIKTYQYTMYFDFQPDLKLQDIEA